MKYLTLEEFKKTVTRFRVGNDDKQSRIDEALKFCGTVGPFYPCYPMFRISEHDGYNSYENWQACLSHPELKLQINYSNHEKKYHTRCVSIEDLNNINRYSIIEAKKSITAPNLIGVLTAKKILQWVNYYESLYAVLKAENDTNSNEIQQFINSMDGLPVKWNSDKKGGAILKNGLEFTFSIQEKFVFTHIKLHYTTGETLAAFIKLSDNKYTSTK